MLENEEVMLDFYEQATRFRDQQNQKYFRLNSEEEDNSIEFLDQLLDPNQMVTIGDYTFRLDLPNEAVYVVAKGSPLQEALIQKDYQKKGIMKFSTSDDVLDLLEAGHTSSPQTANSAIFCGGGCNAYKNLLRTIDLGNYNNVESEVNYIKAGIYFELSHHIFSFYMSTPSGLDPNNGNTPPAPLTSYNARYTPNCRNSSEVIKNEINIEMKYKSKEPGGFFVNSFIFKFKDSLYKSTRGLRKISFTPTYSTRGVNFSGATINCI